jgi:hypothetical protein
MKNGLLSLLIYYISSITQAFLNTLPSKPLEAFISWDQCKYAQTLFSEGFTHQINFTTPKNFPKIWPLSNIKTNLGVPFIKVSFTQWIFQTNCRKFKLVLLKRNNYLPHNNNLLDLFHNSNRIKMKYHKWDHKCYINH